MSHICVTCLNDMSDKCLTNEYKGVTCERVMRRILDQAHSMDHVSYMIESCLTYE